MSMMSEEENKLIRAEFQNLLNKLIDSKIAPTGTAIISAEQPMILLFERVMYKLERQQKEIEENQVLIDDIKEHRIVYIDTPEFEEKFISKDKIREKIEHYNNELEHIKNGEEFENEKPMYYWGKAALEGLLEEN